MRLTKSCLIIGAGMAGLSAAGVLRNKGWEVILVDKGRQPGGRMATRRVGESRFDHGAQFFTVRDARFRDAVSRWEARGWVKPWFAEGGHVRYRGIDGMGGMMKEIAQPFDCRTETHVDCIELVENGWRIRTDEGGELSANTLLLTAPAPQSIPLLSGCRDRLPASMMSELAKISFDPCFALLANLQGPSRVPLPGCVRPGTGPIGFIADNTQKGISGGAAALTIHARADFTRSCFDMPQEEVAQRLLNAAEPWLGSQVVTWQLHRWKYSQPIATCAEPFLYSTAPKPLSFAGDAFGGPRIEGAFLSGVAAAERIVAG